MGAGKMAIEAHLNTAATMLKNLFYLFYAHLILLLILAFYSS